jgi:hypothetical protein
MKEKDLQRLLKENEVLKKTLNSQIEKERHAQQIELLKHHAHFLAHLIDGAQIFAQLDTRHSDAALLVLFQAIDASYQGGFAGSRWATNDNALALANMQVNVTQHMKLTKPFVDFFEGDDGL